MSVDLLNAQTRRLGDAIKKLLPPKRGFALVLFDTEEGNVTGLSNAPRAQTIAMLKSLVEHMEKGQS